jgi:hypothetical protein
VSAFPDQRYAQNCLLTCGGYLFTAKINETDLGDGEGDDGIEFDSDSAEEEVDIDRI